MKNLTYKQKLWVYLVVLIVLIVVSTIVFHNTLGGIIAFALGYFLYTRTIEPYEKSSKREDDSIIDVEDVTEEIIVKDVTKEVVVEDEEKE
ncbi:MAG: hypothetical protein PF505_11805 [Vallitaleaceae bacterium]|jgi:hypothetical protein|nr:hypothetical protein [Vallitaleaceae bacterium]